MEDGVYREIDIDTIADSDKTDLQPELDSVSGTKPTSTRPDDTEPRDVIEQSVYLDIDGEPKRAPYLVTALKDSGEVLAIYRDWREDDAELTRRQRFVDYNFLPGWWFLWTGRAAACAGPSGRVAKRQPPRPVGCRASGQRQGRIP